VGLTLRISPDVFVILRTLEAELPLGAQKKASEVSIERKDRDVRKHVRRIVRIDLSPKD
jgi:hypothetical protein